MSQFLPPPVEEFERAVRLHWRSMLQLAARLASWSEAEDVVQEAVLGAFTHWDQFDKGKGSARNWLLAIVADHSRRRLRQRRLLMGHHRSDLTAPALALPDVDLQRAIATLPHRQRLAVALYYYLDLSVRDVAAAMSCREGTVQATLAGARKNLRARLGQEPR